MKKRIIKILILTLLLILLGCPIMSVHAETGDTAYTYLQEIDRSFPGRVSDITKNPDSGNKVRFAQWIQEKLRSFGYEPVEETFTHSNGTIVTDIIARKTGKSAKRIVIGAHYDSVATKGVEDNGTGVAAALELAQAFRYIDTSCSIDFCFWDGEETLGYAGSYIYLLKYNDGNILCNINLDSIGSGDHLYAASGEYENGQLLRAWPLNMAAEIALNKNIELNVIPEVISDFPTPTMVRCSDQYFFNQNKIPYIYFFTNAWVKENGEIGNPEHIHLYNSALKAFQSTNGQIVHKPEFEDLKTLESLTGSTVKNHMSDTLKIVTELLKNINEASPGNFQSPSWEKLKTKAVSSEEKTSDEVKETTENGNEESVTTGIENEEGTIETGNPGEETSGNETETDEESDESGKEKSGKDRRIKIIGFSLIGVNLLLIAFAVYRIIQIKRKGGRKEK